MSKTTTWPGWQMVKKLGEGSYGSVYEIAKEAGGITYRAALKVISVPTSPEEIEDGYRESWYETERDAKTYYADQIARVTREFEIMERISDCPNIVKCLDHMILPHEDGIGADILICMELLTPLDRWRRSNDISPKEVVKIGMDICRALEVCQAQDPPILHRDIKIANIMRAEDGSYKLGDFGVSRVMEGTKSAHTVVGTENYMAPEVYYGKSYKITADIYSLGIVLYRLLNYNRNPFLPSNGPLNVAMQEAAKAARLGGEAVPEPALGSEMLKKVVLMALNPDPEQRFRTPDAFSMALAQCPEYKSGMNDTFAGKPYSHFSAEASADKKNFAAAEGATVTEKAASPDAASKDIGTDGHPGTMKKDREKPGKKPVRKKKAGKRAGKDPNTMPRANVIVGGFIWAAFMAALIGVMVGGLYNATGNRDLSAISLIVFTIIGSWLITFMERKTWRVNGGDLKKHWVFPMAVTMIWAAVGSTAGVTGSSGAIGYVAGIDILVGLFISELSVIIVTMILRKKDKDKA